VANAVQRLNIHNRFDVLPWQAPGLLARAGLTAEQGAEAAWYIDERGQKHRGAAAINAAFTALGGVYVIPAFLYRIPGLKQLEDAVYAWVARNRHRMPGASDACKLPDAGQHTTREP
jgi:predicted DCC family thiol-disulfide oxidoreductase YuxK